LAQGWYVEVGADSSGETTMSDRLERVVREALAKSDIEMDPLPRSALEIVRLTAKECAEIAIAQDDFTLPHMVAKAIRRAFGIEK
jgi:hypothetical protein